LPATIGLACAVCIFLAPGAAGARTWHVRPDRTGDVPTIQAAVDSAVAGDLILVAPGTYTYTGQGTGDDYALIRFLRGRTDFTLKSEGGPQVTKLDGEWLGRIFYIQGGDENRVTIDGFTIVRGKGQALGDFFGGGLIAHLSSPIIRNCVFQNNYADRGGAVYYAGVSGPRFESCSFIGNRAASGAAIYLINSSLVPTFSDCVIRDNVATSRGGAFYVYHFPFALERCSIYNNTADVEGGAMYCERAYPSTITGCTIAGNRSAAGSAISLSSCEQLTIRSTIVAFNNGGPPLAASLSATAFGCSDVYGNAVSDALPPGAVDDGTCFFLDPRFCGSPAAGNLFLRSDSPCIMRSEDDAVICGLTGAYPAACGPVAVKRTSWGAVKGLFGPR
jgi:hypothetical protein